MKRLLKKEIETVNTGVLNMHYCRILERGETMAAKDIPVADAKQILWIEDELRKRLITFVGHDFYPPDRIEKKHPSNYMVSLLKRNKPKLELKPVSTNTIINMLRLPRSLRSLAMTETLRKEK